MGYSSNLRARIGVYREAERCRLTVWRGDEQLPRNEKELE